MTKGAKMVARLGHVLGWTGDIVGGLLMLVGAYWGLVGTTDKLVMFLVFFVPGFVIFLIGRAGRYVLAGKGQEGNLFIHNTSELIILLVIAGALIGCTPTQSLERL
jgi:hypothetical protein